MYWRFYKKDKLLRIKQNIAHIGWSDKNYCT